MAESECTVHGANDSDQLTALVVPALLTSPESIERIIERLWNHAEGSHWDRNIYVGLLSDFADANREDTEPDAALLNAALTGISRLNDRAAPDHGPRFFLLHRPRRWSNAQGRWMGAERKRGKLADLNSFLTSGDTTPFSAISGPVDQIVGARFVITMDEDNELCSGGARALIDRMLRPACRPRLDPAGRRVTTGHAMLQPLALNFAVSAKRTAYETFQVESGSALDRVELYYQALFDEGTFLGKGIYDVAAFAAVLKDKFPLDTILSHDIVEGCLLRSALVAQVGVKEAVPRSVDDELRRNHRWYRGDWQTAAWMVSEIVAGRGAAFSPLSRFKIVDYARRALLPIGVALLMSIGIAFENSTWALLCLVLSLRAAAFVLTHWFPPTSAKLLGHGMEPGPTSLLRAQLSEVARELMFLMLLPAIAWNAASAIGLSQWRVHISKRRTLDWTPSSAHHGDGGWPVLHQLYVTRANYVTCALVIYAWHWEPTGPTVVQIVGVSYWLSAAALTWWLAR